MAINKRWHGIIIHASDSTFGTAFDINLWHKRRDFDMIGYHFVITNGQLSPSIYLGNMDGSIEAGRNLNYPNSAHALGYNSTHIGICAISKGKHTPKQVEAIYNLVVSLMSKYSISIEDVLGHKEVANKECPFFEVSYLREAILYNNKDIFINYMLNKG